MKPEFDSRRPDSASENLKMNIDTFIQIIATVAGVIMSVGYYPQALAMYRSKSAENVSRLSYSIFAFGTTTWLLYGLYLHNLTIVLSFVFGVVGSWLVLLLTLYYRGNKGARS